MHIDVQYMCIQIHMYIYIYILLYVHYDDSIILVNQQHGLVSRFVLKWVFASVYAVVCFEETVAPKF